MARCRAPWMKEGSGKIQHPTQEAAQAHADELNQLEDHPFKFRRHFTVYQCDRCGFWHAGSLDKKVYAHESHPEPDLTLCCDGTHCCEEEPWWYADFTED